MRLYLQWTKIACSGDATDFTKDCSQSTSVFSQCNHYSTLGQAGRKGDEALEYIRKIYQRFFMMLGGCPRFLANWPYVIRLLHASTSTAIDQCRLHGDHHFVTQETTHVWLLDEWRQLYRKAHTYVSIFRAFMCLWLLRFLCLCSRVTRSHILVENIYVTHSGFPLSFICSRNFVDSAGPQLNSTVSKPLKNFTDHTYTF